ncbi:MAG: ATP-binding cassette domain-containing protein [Cytophagales bacterium]|nr:ATP-binding cassette domain-containing protein [Cytophagales bacterium]MDW8384484.1 ATP-binding cassette domain-containing protein [Flammeovirgaceae bacterium]
MSEEILKALTQLFAIISKQDEGVSETEREFVISYFRQELDSATLEEYIKMYDQFAGYGVEEKVGEDEEKKKTKKSAVNVKDSVRTLALCKKINKTLNQRQKVIVLVKLLEMLASDNDFSDSKMEIIHTVSDVFNILPEEYRLLERFAKENDITKFTDDENYLIFDEEPPIGENVKAKWIDSGYLDGEIIFVRLKSVGLYFTKYNGNDEILLNNKVVRKGSLLQFAPGSIFKTPKGAPLYYSDLVSKFNQDAKVTPISFNVENVEFRFPNGTIGLRNVNLSETQGNLIGIMGASGAGKTTLLNVLAGLEKPYKGSVKINGFDVHREPKKIEGVIGYIAQDDLLIEELTVYQNLYYNAKLCFRDLSEEEIDKKVKDTLASLGLDRISDLVVGNVLNKKISGGQRKRLNIALELIREPSVLFVDEPTSGLSSRDSENVIDLLKELALKGKLIFVVIHQPSSDIYKMFDKMWILDTGGYPVFYGNPVEAVIYFKTAAQQVGAERGQCPTCGNVNPEQIFNIIEAKVVDEYGEFTNKRKVMPHEWHNLYQEKIKIEKKPDVNELPPKNLAIPNRLVQTIIFTTRDFLSKVSNKQYMAINLLEAPLLALLLSWVIRYRKNDELEYIYRHNDNIPAYILIAVIIALFMGLTVSAEEIIHDRKIQKRETFLNLSRFSYLSSKLIILFGLSAIQSLSFVLIGNTILDIEDLNWMYWLVLFTISCHANVLGLNISSAFNSAVTVYIIIPLLLIPQMILSGLIFDYDKLNNSISDRGKVPLIADFMASRWAYEAMAVEQFRDNDYNRELFETEIIESENSYKVTYWIPKLQDIINEVQDALEGEQTPEKKELIANNLTTIANEIQSDDFFRNIAKFDVNQLKLENFRPEVLEQIEALLSSDNAEGCWNYYNTIFTGATEKKDSILYVMQQKVEKEYNMEFTKFKDQFYNDELADLLKGANKPEKCVVSENRIVQVIDPVYNIPDSYGRFFLDYRTHFFAPKKIFMGKEFDTLTFNIMAIWFMTFILYIALYFELLAKAIKGMEKIGRRLETVKTTVKMPKIILRKKNIVAAFRKSKANKAEETKEA